MDIKKMIEKLIDEIQKDGKLGAQFEKEPVKVIEGIIGKDLPDDVVEKIIDGVKAKIAMEKVGDALDMLDGALDKEAMTRNVRKTFAENITKNTETRPIDKYDYIVIDTPPVNVVTDAMGVSKSVAGIFLILKYGSTTFDEAEQAMKTISLANMNMLGFIMNDIKNKGNGSTYSKSKYSDYGYGDEPKEKSDKENK